MIDWTKPVWTKKDHLPVEVKFTNGRGYCPVGAYIGTAEVISHFALDGSYFGIEDYIFNLENVPEPEVRLPPFPFPIADGEVYAGLSRDPDTGAWHHLVLLPATPGKDFTWQEAIDWAKSVGGDLPTRREQALLFANRGEGQFKEAWYWSCEEDADEPSGAWAQYFDDGSQDFLFKDCRYPARAVRRVPVWIEEKK